MQLTIFLTIATLIRIILASLFPLTADESYYWLWSKHLSLSYVDHPPMVALINFLFTFGSENLFLLRLGAVTTTLLVSIIIYLLAKHLFNEKAAFWSVVLFQIIPHFVVVWLTMFVELPLVLFWTLSLLLISKIILASPNRLPASKPASTTLSWLLLGITIGLGYLSKYTMFLFWPCLLIFFWLSPDNRSWLKRKELYLCFFISLSFFIPVLYWNSQHGWVSFTFHGGKATADPWGANALPFIADQLVHFTPFLLFALYPVFKNALHKSQATKLLFSFSAPILFLFFLLSFKIKVWAHWPSAGYIAAIPLTANYLIENDKPLKKFLAWISLFSFIVLIILLWVSPRVLMHQKDYAQNYKLNALVPKEFKVFAKTNVSASLLEFYLRRPVYLATGFLKRGPLWGEKQYEIWGILPLNKGESILYYGEDTPYFRQKAARYFRKISEEPQMRLSLVEDYISNHYKMFKLEGFKEQNLKP